MIESRFHVFSCEQGKINKSPYLNMTIKANRKNDDWNKQLKNLKYDNTSKHGKYDYTHD